MSILKVARMGHPVLRALAKSVDATEVRTAAFQKLIDDMIETMTEYEGIGLINSGGASGANDFADALRTAVINKRAGGMGLISGRKSFQRPMKEGIELLHAIQDVYLNPAVTIA